MTLGTSITKQSHIVSLLQSYILRSLNAHQAVATKECLEVLLSDRKPTCLSIGSLHRQIRLPIYVASDCPISPSIPTWYHPSDTCIRLQSFTSDPSSNCRPKTFETLVSALQRISRSPQ